MGLLVWSWSEAGITLDWAQDQREEDHQDPDSTDAHTMLPSLSCQAHADNMWRWYIRMYIVMLKVVFPFLFIAILS